MRTPYFLIEESKIVRNLEILADVKRRTGCKILLAQKAYSAFFTYPLIAGYLDGTAASGLYEARLGKTAFGKETHVFSPAYNDEEWDELMLYADHVIFNSPTQARKFLPRAKAAGKQVGLRLNPECSTQEGHGIYDPCGKYSRLGTTKANLDAETADMLDGVHMHTLCEQDSDALEVTVAALEEKFGDVLKKAKWINLGGGHHITREGYDIDRLVRTVNGLADRYGAQVYLEPGDAVVLNAGQLVCRVEDITDNGMKIAILDASAACHMPDVIEMPYRPPLQGSGLPDEKKYTYRLGGPTCLAGDVIGDYSFDRPLRVGDILRFEDMALYTMVKTNTFNGMRLPSICLEHSDGSVETVKEFCYEDFAGRLG